MRTLFLSALLWTAITSSAFSQTCGPYDTLVTTTPTPPFQVSWDTHQRTLAALRTQSDLILLGDNLAQFWDVGMWAPTEVQNLGVLAESTQHVLLRLNEPVFRKVTTNRILLMVGTNNITRGDKACAIAAGINAIVARLRDIWPQASITILEIPPRGDRFKFRDELRRTSNDLIRKIPGIKTVNVDDQITCNWTEPCPNYGPDKINFVHAGYNQLLQLLRPIVLGP